MGKRGRARGKVDKLSAPESEYVSAEGDVLVLRGALTPKTRVRYHETLHGNALSQEDACSSSIWPCAGSSPTCPPRVSASC
jgi:hypothetical protein